MSPDVKPDLVKRLAELLDGDAWSLADTLVDEFSEDEFPAADGVRNGLYAALDRYAMALESEYGLDRKKAVSTMRVARGTAMAWPADSRPSAAFTVLSAIRGDDRVADLARYERKSKAENGKPLTLAKLRRYRQEEKPQKLVSYEQRLRSAIANATRREMLGGITTKRTDWWMAVTVAERDVAVRELRALAAAIDAGEIAS